MDLTAAVIIHGPGILRNSGNEEAREAEAGLFAARIGVVICCLPTSMQNGKIHKIPNGPVFYKRLEKL